MCMLGCASMQYDSLHLSLSIPAISYTQLLQYRRVDMNCQPWICHGLITKAGSEQAKLLHIVLE